MSCISHVFTHPFSIARTLQQLFETLQGMRLRQGKQYSTIKTCQPDDEIRLPGIMGVQTQTQLRKEIMTSFNKRSVLVSNHNCCCSSKPTTILLTLFHIDLTLHNSHRTVLESCYDHDLLITQKLFFYKIKTLERFPVVFLW